ncbi:hypothetical protein [Devosia sp. SL43]|uniref:hypothetical protein n=1 Tax=Devosia sp. SL43 TaxID=2806348 RepID=UPI001F2EFADC|nr:hypothetical protein [Devosia sp. SL43]UJW85169.1 hypothetical protein IM737_17455 [Devosia sp. SL43]
MSLYALDEGNASLRLESHVTKAVHHHGVWPVLRVVILAWWNRPRLPPDLSPRLRADMGLPPDTRPTYWPEPSANPQVPPPMWRPGL